MRPASQTAQSGVLNLNQDVVYRPHPDAPAELGKILRFSADDASAFVLYRGDPTPKSTRLADLAPAPRPKEQHDVGPLREPSAETS